ncbi:MAG: hypothetical protein H7039_06755, partial [Bryobacteraceae bacterium]|nr:hypothetical protein [Bryobacteraceae bacterium]
MFVKLATRLCIALIGIGASAQTTSTPEQTALKRYCVGCHNAKVKTAGLAFEGMTLQNVGLHSQDWEKVARKLQTRSMPPAGLPRPDERTYSSLLATLESSLDQAAAATV